MIATAPALTPVTTPLVLIEAIEVDPEDQTPPLVASDNVVVLPAQNDEVPVMAATVGFALTFNTSVAALSQPTLFVKCTV